MDGAAHEDREVGRTLRLSMAAPLDDDRCARTVPRLPRSGKRFSPAGTLLASTGRLTAGGVARLTAGKVTRLTPRHLSRPRVTAAA